MPGRRDGSDHRPSIAAALRVTLVS
jgi:hypothetical protein